MVTVAHAPRAALLTTALTSVLLTLVVTRLWPHRGGSVSCSAGGAALGHGRRTGKILVFQHIYAINNYREVVQDQVRAVANQPSRSCTMRTKSCTVSVGSQSAPSRGMARVVRHRLARRVARRVYASGWQRKPGPPRPTQLRLLLPCPPDSRCVCRPTGRACVAGHEDPVQRPVPHSGCGVQHRVRRAGGGCGCRRATLQQARSTQEALRIRTLHSGRARCRSVGSPLSRP